MTAFALTSPELADLVRHVCELDVRAFKPGNVSVASPGHGMTAEDFLKSAEAMALPLTLPGLKVGERILAAVRATLAAAGCNTNLGIVLLLAPLVQAALLDAAEGDLRARLGRVLAELDVDDAALAFEAIRVANPGGLGHSARHDVSTLPQVSLLEAMREAAHRDRIAYQYVSGYEDIFETGLVSARAALESWQNEEWAVVAVYLALLSRFPDTHIERKFGAGVAQRVTRRAAEMGSQLSQAQVPGDMMPALEAMDRELKASGFNPGTSADLTVGSIAVLHLQEMLDRRVNGQTAEQAAGLYPRRAPRSPDRDPRILLTIA